MAQAAHKGQICCKERKALGTSINRVRRFLKEVFEAREALKSTFNRRTRLIQDVKKYKDRTNKMYGPVFMTKEHLGRLTHFLDDSWYQIRNLRKTHRGGMMYFSSKEKQKLRYFLLHKVNLRKYQRKLPSGSIRRIKRMLP